MRLILEDDLINISSLSSPSAPATDWNGPQPRIDRDLRPTRRSTRMPGHQSKTLLTAPPQYLRGGTYQHTSYREGNADPTKATQPLVENKRSAHRAVEAINYCNTHLPDSILVSLCPVSLNDPFPT